MNLAILSRNLITLHLPTLIYSILYIKTLTLPLVRINQNKTYPSIIHTAIKCYLIWKSKLSTSKDWLMKKSIPKTILKLFMLWRGWSSHLSRLKNFIKTKSLQFLKKLIIIKLNGMAKYLRWNKCTFKEREC